MTAPYTPFQSLPQPNEDASTKIKWSARSKRSLSASNSSVIQIFRSHRDNLAQRIKNSNKTHHVAPPQPLLPAHTTSSPDMAPLTINIDANELSSDQFKESYASSTSPDRSLKSGGTAALSFSDDSSSPLTPNNKKTHITPPINIYADTQPDVGGDDSEGDWVDFPTQSFPSNQDDFGSFGCGFPATMLGDGTHNDDVDARKCLFNNVNVDWNGFIDDSSASSSIIESFQTEVKELKEELSRTQERLENANITNEALNEAHDQKHKELEQLNEDMDKFSDIIMLCMQKLRERNVALESDNDDLRRRMKFLTRCTEALNDAHDRKSEECEELKNEMERFAETFATQHDNMQELEGRLRNVMAENEELKSSLGVRSNSGKSSRRRRSSIKMERIDETSDDEDDNIPLHCKR